MNRFPSSRPRFQPGSQGLSIAPGWRNVPRASRQHGRFSPTPRPGPRALCSSENRVLFLQPARTPSIPFAPGRPRRSVEYWVHWGLAAVAAVSLAWALAGCSSPPPPKAADGAYYWPANFHRRAPRLPDSIRRVAVLPTVFDTASPDATAGAAALEPVLNTELAKTRKFELLFVSGKMLREITGRPVWSAEEPLPKDFLEKLHASLGCDAVVFRRLTVYRAYPPMAVGWSLKLVETPAATIWWAADEVFDADQPAVVNGARRYQKQVDFASGAADDSGRVLNSPRTFGHYAASVLLGTLPER